MTEQQAIEWLAENNATVTFRSDMRNRSLMVAFGYHSVSRFWIDEPTSRVHQTTMFLCMAVEELSRVVGGTANAE